MSEGAVDRVVEIVATLRGQFYPLLLLVGSSGSGKTEALQAVAKRTDIPYINVNLHLGEQLLPLSDTQRALRVSRLLEDLVGEAGDAVLLDNLEMLFHPALKLEPLRALQDAARHTNTAVVASWNGAVTNGMLTYAEPGHREWRRYPAGELLLMGVE